MHMLRNRHAMVNQWQISEYSINPMYDVVYEPQIVMSKGLSGN